LASLHQQYLRSGAPLPRPRPAEAPQGGMTSPQQPVFASSPGPQAAPQPGTGAMPSEPGMRAGMPTSPAQNIARALPALLEAIGNSKLPPGTREQAKLLAEHALKTSDLPEDQKNYGLYLTQGGRDDFT